MTDILPPMQTVEDFVRTGKAISDPTRIRILSCLAMRDLSVASSFT